VFITVTAGPITKLFAWGAGTGGLLFITAVPNTKLCVCVGGGRRACDAELCVFITAVPITKRRVCGFITAGPIIKLCAGRGTVWDSITGTCVCVYYCSTYYKAVRRGGGE
jgi:hypothetical protein